MSSLSAALGSSASPVTIQWQGKTYAIHSMGMKALETLENWLISRKVEALAETWDLGVKKGWMTPSDAIAKAEAFTHKCLDDRTYSFGSEVMNQILFDAPKMPTPDEVKARVELFKRDPAAAQEYMNKLTKPSWMNKLKLFSLIMTCDGGPVDIDDVIAIYNAKGTEFLAKMNLVMEGSMPAGKE